MDLYPAIDLRAGNCVRLYQGNYSEETVYGSDPAAQARIFAQAGAPWIHVVDLDAARTGEQANLAAVRQICESVDVPVQCGGGVRSLDAARALVDAGVARVVVGTAAVEQPTLVEQIAKHCRVAVGLDARGRDVATHGWETPTGQDLVELARHFGPIADALVVTEIAVDGTLAGPALDQLRLICTATAETDIAIIASGGIGDVGHIEQLALLTGETGKSLSGAILGRALYEGTVDLVDALRRATSRPHVTEVES